jgi:hypothetical protein
MRLSVVVLMGMALSLPAAGRENRPPALVLAERRGEAVPLRSGWTHVGVGAIDVRQPTPDAFVLTLLGAAAATAHPRGSDAALDFDVTQTFAVVAATAADRPKLSLEVELVGLLRGGRGAAAASGAAAILAGPAAVASATLPGRVVACGKDMTVADRSAPDDVAVAPGGYELCACWRLCATHPETHRGKAASAEFAAEPALPPVLTYGPRDPFHGVAKKDFGFRVTVRVAPAPDRAAAVELR